MIPMKRNVSIRISPQKLDAEIYRCLEDKDADVAAFGERFQFKSERVAAFLNPPTLYGHVNFVIIPQADLTQDLQDHAISLLSLVPPHESAELVICESLKETRLIIAAEPAVQPPSELGRELAGVVNKFSAENGSDTPDFILAAVIEDVIASWNKHVRERDRWHGRINRPNMPIRPEVPVSQELLFDAMGLAVETIEAAGASTELTDAGIIVADIRRIIGNRWNPSDPYAVERVRRYLKDRGISKEAFESA